MSKMKVSKNLGFTLIELLVVISIIGFLATATMVIFNNVRIKARDVKRIADIKQIQKALDLYYDENNAYPISGDCNATSPVAGWCNSIQSMSGGHWLRTRAVNLGKFLVQDPVDPKPVSSPNWLPIGGGTYFYYANGYGGAGQWYMIIYGLEDKAHPMQNLDGVKACDGTVFHYGSGSNGIITVGGDCATK
ncbi:type II secretion system GspH family protein [Patescibacteria group bacterium]|nr:type II secretion system GspH family protein [Patescibacteria group bacterium]MBU2233627.1 type II secretion system GspH family protein [Patescibacteria group bacterium]MBU2264374.1 type II secretion system GspH family protein [Patescibacteria group bacterium]